MTSTETPIRFDTAKVQPGRCAVCGRKVSEASMDSGRATAYLVDETGTVIETGATGWAWVGPECRKAVEASATLR